MAQVRGSDSQILLLEESSYKTLPATPAGIVQYVSNFGGSKTQNRTPSALLSGNRARVEGILGNVDVTGDLSTEINAQSMAWLVKHAMGTVTTTGSGPYTHVFDIGNLPPGITFEVDYGSTLTGTGRFVQYKGCRVSSMALSFPTEGACTATFSVIGANGDQAAATLDASPTDPGATPFSAFDAAIVEGGSAIATVKSIDVTLDNGLDTDGYVIGGSGERAQLPEGFASVTGTLTAVFEDLTLLNKALAGTETSLKITLQHGTGDGSSSNEYFEVNITKMKYDPQTPPIDGPGGLVVTLPFSAYRVGSDNGFQVTIKNSISTI